MYDDDPPSVQPTTRLLLPPLPSLHPSLSSSVSLLCRPSPAPPLSPSLPPSSTPNQACRAGDNDVVKRLLADHGSYPLEKATADGNTGLHLACAEGRLPTVRLLSSINKCNQEAVNHFVRTPLHEAVIRSQPAVVRYLVQKFDDERARGLDKELMTDVTSSQHTAKLIGFIARSAKPINVDCQDFLGWTPLHYAIDNNSLACAKALVKLGNGR